MLGNRNEIARLQSDFYRDKYYSVLRALLISVCLTVALIGVIIYLILFAAPPKYYASATTGQIISLSGQSG